MFDKIFRESGYEDKRLGYGGCLESILSTASGVLQ